MLWMVACQAPVCGIFQARILEWVAVPFARGSSQPRDRTNVFCASYIASGFFACWALGEAIFKFKPKPVKRILSITLLACEMSTIVQ